MAKTVDWRDWIAGEQAKEAEAVRQHGEDSLLEVMNGTCPPPRAYGAAAGGEWEGDVDFASLPGIEWWDLQKMGAAS